MCSASWRWVSRAASRSARRRWARVAQITVQKALQLLKDEGLVVGVGGYGTFISEELEE